MSPNGLTFTFFLIPRVTFHVADRPPAELYERLATRRTVSHRIASDRISSSSIRRRSKCHQSKTVADGHRRGFVTHRSPLADRVQLVDAPLTGALRILCVVINVTYGFRRHEFHWAPAVQKGRKKAGRGRRRLWRHECHRKLLPLGRETSDIFLFLVLRHKTASESEDALAFLFMNKIYVVTSKFRLLWLST
jgi:hypothetical protein